jgi:hypothetical protein
VREKPIMARHHRMPSEEAGYTYAVESAATNRLLANEEESIYGLWENFSPIYSNPPKYEGEVAFAAKWLHEYDTKNRLEGDHVFLSFMISL